MTEARSSKHPLKLRNCLPQELQDEDEELIERFVTVLYFITNGMKAGERLLARAQEKLNKAATDDEREKAQKEVNFAEKVLPSRNYLRFPEKNDALLDRLEKLGLIETLSSEPKTISRRVKLTEKISPIQANVIVDTYQGIYPPYIHHAVAKDPVALLDKVASKGRREEFILRDWDATKTPEWAFHVPRWFNSALDIQLISRKWNTVEYTVWAQGVNFSFRAGDVLYQDLDDYLQGTPALFVESAINARGTKPEGLNTGADTSAPELAELENDEPNDAAGKDFFPGSVTFRDCVTDEVKTVTQVEFVKMLMGGTRQ